MRAKANLVLGIVLLLAIGYCVWIGLHAFGDWFGDLNRDEAVAFVAFAGVILSPLISFFTTRAIERRRAADEATRLSKIEIYESFINFWITTLNDGSADDTEKVLEFFSTSTPQLITYASSDFLKKYRSFRAEAFSEHADATKQLFLFEEMLKSIRKDLGHSTFTFTKGDILATWVNDIEDHV